MSNHIYSELLSDAELWPWKKFQRASNTYALFHLCRQQILGLKNLNWSQACTLCTLWCGIGSLACSCEDAPKSKVFCRTALFSCEVCSHEEWRQNDRGRVEEPKKCTNPECNTAWSMKLIHNRCAFYNKQIVKMQVKLSYYRMPPSRPDHSIRKGQTDLYHTEYQFYMEVPFRNWQTLRAVGLIFETLLLSERPALSIKLQHALQLSKWRTQHSTTLHKIKCSSKRMPGTWLMTIELCTTCRKIQMLFLKEKRRMQ